MGEQFSTKMNSILFISIVLGLFLQQAYCVEDCTFLATGQKGVCVTRGQCRTLANGSSRSWIPWKSLGKVRALGCEDTPRGFRCCLVHGSSSTSAPTTQTTAPTTVPTTVPTPPATTDSEASVFLDFHNKERACFGLPAMTWSVDLENQAKQYAFKCHYGHSPRDSRQAPPQGENLAAGGGFGWASNDLINGWLSEQIDWSCADNDCGTGKVCGHYTQMLWKDSTQLGCASVQCHTGSPWGSGKWTYVVCRYNPPGNYIGRHPLNPVTDTGPTANCGCARSALEPEDVWGIEDEPVCTPGEVLEPSNGDATADTRATTCACPPGAEALADGTCIAEPVPLACENEPVTCDDGVEVYSQPPECEPAVCPDAAPANAIMTSLGAVGIAALAL